MAILQETKSHIKNITTTVVDNTEPLSILDYHHQEGETSVTCTSSPHSIVDDNDGDDADTQQHRNSSSVIFSSIRRKRSSQFQNIQASSHLILTEQEADNEATPTKYNGNSLFKIVFTTIGLLVGFITCFITIENNPHINQTLAIGIWMATLWITEIIPLVVTGFLPLVLFPMFGILSSGDVASQYVNDTIFLFIAGLLVALTLERWNLHRRFSLKVLQNCGTKPPILLLGMMGASFFLSMFISNTATTLMMVPNALSICTTLADSGSATFREQGKRFTVALMLGIAYAANVGGMSSLIGTAPNLVFQRQLELLFPDSQEFSFAHWIAFGLPTGLVMLVFIWVIKCPEFYCRGLSARALLDCSPEVVN